MMGFYPDCPGEPHYTLTTPRFEKIEITLDPQYTGKDKLVITRTPGEDMKFIGGINVGGKKFKGYRISHSDLTGSGEIDFMLKEDPSL